MVEISPLRGIVRLTSAFGLRPARVPDPSDIDAIAHLLRPPSVPAGRHPPGRLAVFPLHSELP